MKPFKINRDSWHYKLNKHFLNSYGDNEYHMRNSWESKHNNFCSYWRVTMFRLVAAVLVAFGISMLLIGIGKMFYYHPWDSFVIVGSAVGMIATLIAVAVCGVMTTTFLEKRRNKNSEVPDSLFVAKYKAYKSKVCQMVEYDK